MKNNNPSIIMGCAIIISFTILGFFLTISSSNDSSNVVNKNNEYRYELVPVNENNIFIFDKETGQYWNKFVPSNEGPTNWEKGESPIKK